MDRADRSECRSCRGSSESPDRNAKRDAASRDRPSSSPAVIVMPDRDVPGTIASICRQPISSASRHDTSNSVVPERGTRVSATHNSSAESDGRRGDQEQRARIRLASNRAAVSRARRSAALPSAPAPSAARRHPPDLRGTTSTTRRRSAPDPAGNTTTHRDKRAGVHRDVEHQSLRRPAEQHRDGSTR